MRKSIFLVLVLLMFVGELYSQPEQFNFNVGNCEYFGKVKSVSIYEYEQLYTDDSINSALSTIEVPSKYFEYSLHGKMITRIVNSSKFMIATKNEYDKFGNIKYEIKSKIFSDSSTQDFRKKIALWKNELAFRSDSIAEFTWGKNRNLGIVVYHYDYANFLVIRMPYLFAPPSHLKLDKNGNIINEKRFSYQYGVLKTTEFAREYLADKILLERITKDKEQIFKRYLYDSTTGNISNLIIDNGSGLLIRHEVYTYSDDIDRVLMYDSNNTLTREIVKKKKLNSTITTHFKIGPLGNREKSSEKIEYKDKFNNVIKKYSFNSQSRKVKVSEFHFEYY